MAMEAGISTLPRVPSSPQMRLRDDWREILRRQIDAAHPRFRSMRAVSLAAELNETAVSEWLRETPGYKPKSPSFASLAAVARVLQVSMDIFVEGGAVKEFPRPGAVTPLRVRGVTVVGNVQAGAWKEARALENEDREEVYIPYIEDGRFRGFPQFAWRVIGPSVNKLAQHGQYVITVRFIDLGRGPAEGEAVICERRKGSACEYTVKRVHFEPSGDIHLLPDSTDPRFQDPLWKSSQETQDNEVEATQLVIGVYAPV